MESPGEKAVLHVQNMQATWNNEKQKYQEAINKLCAENKDLKARLALGEQSYVKTIETLRAENDTLKTEIKYWFVREKSSMQFICHTPAKSETNNITFTYQTPGVLYTPKEDEKKDGKKDGKKGITVTQNNKALSSYEKERKSLPVSRDPQRKLFNE